MNIFITGAGGYIGGSLALHFAKAGHEIRGLARNERTSAALRRSGVVPVIGDLGDADLLSAEARRADAVINAADSDHRGAVEALIAGLIASGKPLVHTSGSSVVSDDARGEGSDHIYDEDTMPAPEPYKAERVAVDMLVRAAERQGIRSVIVCNSLIYGHGVGPKRDSIQIPALIRQARKSGVVRHVGRGLNIWSTVHIDDVLNLYAVALDKAEAGSFFFAEAGEATFGDIAQAIARALGMGEARPWSVDEAVQEWGYERAVFALGSNSRVRGKRARADMGWTPKHLSVLQWIESHVSMAPTEPETADSSGQPEPIRK